MEVIVNGRYVLCRVCIMLCTIHTYTVDVYISYIHTHTNTSVYFGALKT